jgi:hypothetical protein
MPIQQIVPVVCLNCRGQFTTPVETIIDGQDMAMKSAFLQGLVNVFRCPQCGAINRPNIPLLYYDLEKELAFVLSPTELHLAGTAQDKIIGDLTNTLVNSLPAEQRKFYLFNPKLFLTFESMVKAILEADGVTEEMLQAQQARIKLLQEFLQAPDEAALKELVKVHDAELDYEFFELLTYYMQSAQMEGDRTRAQTFFALRSLLRRWSSRGKKFIAEVDAKMGLVIVQSQEELLEKLQQTQTPEEFEALVSAGQPLLDYTFFQKLTANIDAATQKGDQATSAKLRELRGRILEVKAKVEEAGRAALEKASVLLKEILQSNRPDQVIEQKLDQIDEAFFYILNANIEEARRRGQQDAARALETIGNMILGLLQGPEPATPETPASTEPDKPQEEKPQILIASR